MYYLYTRPGYLLKQPATTETFCGTDKKGLSSVLSVLNDQEPQLGEHPVLPFDLL